MRHNKMILAAMAVSMLATAGHAVDSTPVPFKIEDWRFDRLQSDVLNKLLDGGDESGRVYADAVKEVLKNDKVVPQKLNKDQFVYMSGTIDGYYVPILLHTCIYLLTGVDMAADRQCYDFVTKIVDAHNGRVKKRKDSDARNADMRDGNCNWLVQKYEQISVNGSYLSSGAWVREYIEDANKAWDSLKDMAPQLRSNPLHCGVLRRWYDANPKWESIIQKYNDNVSGLNGTTVEYFIDTSTYTEEKAFQKAKEWLELRLNDETHRTGRGSLTGEITCTGECSKKEIMASGIAGILSHVMPNTLVLSSHLKTPARISKEQKNLRPRLFI